MARLKTPRNYRGKAYGIPFPAVENRTTIYKVKLKIPEETLENTGLMRTIAANHFITHYFPEFYPAISDIPAFEAIGGHTSVFDFLKEGLIDGTTVSSVVDTTPASKKKIVIFNLAYDVYAARNQLTTNTFYTDKAAPPSTPKLQDQMPSFEDSLAFFNAEMGYGPTESQASFNVKAIPLETKKVQATLKKMGKQRDKRNAPQLPETIDFDFLDRSIGKIMGELVAQLMETMRGDGKTYKISEGDLLTLYFGTKTQTSDKAVFIPPQVITGIKYLAPDKSIQEKCLKVGHFSLIKYGHLMSDKTVVSSLKNYKSIIKMEKKATKTGGTFPLDTFFSDAFDVDTSKGLPLNWNPVESPGGPETDQDNALINLATDLGVIDVADTANLQYSMGAYTSTQLSSITDVITRNPAAFARVFETEQNKSEMTAPDFLDKIEQTLLEGPLAAIPGDSPLSAFFRHFGITTLVKEALLCLTFGINFEIARIVDIIGQLKDTIDHGNISVEFGGSVKGITKPQIPIPSLGDLSIAFPVFTVSGDLWKKILEIVIQALEKALIEVIQQLVELLRQLCDFNNPRSRDFGDQDIRDFLPDDRPKDPAGTRGVGQPDMGGRFGPFDPFAGTNLEDPSGEGFSPDGIFDYLADLSTILSSIEICILLTNPAAATEELLEKLLDFNKEYSDPNVSGEIVDFTAIVGFFKEVARVADVTKLCNEIANEAVTVNQNNICLTEEDLQSIHLDDSENIETLLEILEKGLVPGGAGGVPEVIQPNLECPDSPNYIEDPTFRKSCYEVMSGLAEMIEIQFGYSAESIKSVLLDSKLSRGGGAVWEAMEAVTAEVGEGVPDEWKRPPDKAIIDGLKTMMNGMKNAEGLADQIQACINDNQDLVEANASVNIDVIYEVLQLIIEGLEVGFAVGGKIDSLIDGLQDASDAAGDTASNAPLINTKVFNKAFYKQFINYINFDQEDALEQLTDSAASMLHTPALFKVPNHFEGDRGGLMASDFETLQWSFTPIKRKPPSALPKFPTQQITAKYPGYQKGIRGSYEYQLDQLFEVNAARTTATTALLSEHLSDSKVLDLDPFVDAVLDSLHYGKDIPNNPASFMDPTLATLKNVKIKYAVQRLFPAANALLTDYIFDYYIKNGIFDAATLQSLSFFHNNENCAPADVSDFLDVDGIISKMIGKFEMLVCSKSKLPARKKLRLAIKYGMYLLFIQVNIAELILKNIFVFSAMELDELFAKQFVSIFIRDQIQVSIAEYLKNGPPGLETMINEDLVNMFTEFAEAEGGITDFNGNVVFPTNEPIEPTIPSYTKILNFLIDERIYASRTAVNNALKQARPNANPQSMEKIFLSSIPSYTARAERWPDIHNSGEPWFERLHRLAVDPHFAALHGDPGFEEFGQQGGISTATHPRLFIVKTYGTPFGEEIGQEEASHPWDPDAAGGQEPPDPNEGTPNLPGAGSQLSEDIAATPLPGAGGSYGLHGGYDLGPAESQYPGSGPPAEEEPEESVYPGSGGNNLVLDTQEAIDPPPPTVWDPTSLGTGLRPAVTFLVRYRFYLYFPDPDSPASNATVSEADEFLGLRLYPLFPPGNRLSGTAYDFQDKTLDRMVNFHSEDDPEYQQALTLPPAGLRPEPLTGEDMEWILNNEGYKKYFSEVFDRGLLGVIPLIQNFYLTNIYFNDIGTAMTSTKDAALSVVRITIKSDDKYDKTPDMSRSSSSTIKNADDINFDSLARDFIIKVLIMMPIEILKSILELIDPHVALSKMIRTITGQIFNQLSRAFDEILSSVEGPLKEIIGTGEDLLTMVLCMMDIMMKTGGVSGDSAKVTATVEKMKAFFPRISKEGIDFVGSILGMFMIPPSPLGILYLLLSLINVEPQDLGPMGIPPAPGDTSTTNSSLPPPGPTDC